MDANAEEQPRSPNEWAPPPKELAMPTPQKPPQTANKKDDQMAAFMHHAFCFI